MDIITGITTALATLKTGFEIKKIAGNLDSEVQQSELRVEIRKLQESLIDVQDVLLDAKQEIINNRMTIQQKDVEIKQLQIKIQKQSELDYQNETISEECLEILKIFTTSSSSHSVNYLSKLSDMNIQRVIHIIEILKDKDIIDNVFSFGEPSFVLTKRGRKYLIDEKLI